MVYVEGGDWWLCDELRRQRQMCRRESQGSEQTPLQATLDPDQLVAGFVWQLRDYDEKQWSEEQDLARFLWDEAPAKQEDTPQLARFLWRDAMPTVSLSGTHLTLPAKGLL